MSSTRVFRCRPESVRDARLFVRDSLSDQAVETVEAAELMTSELVTNSIRHACTDVEVTISLDGVIRVEVSDSGGGRPVLRSPTASEPSGRGLRIVEGMSDEWGVIGGSRGKSVWFTLPSERDAHAGEPREGAGAQHAGSARRTARPAGTRPRTPRRRDTRGPSGLTRPR